MPCTKDLVWKQSIPQSIPQSGREAGMAETKGVLSLKGWERPHRETFPC